MTPQEYERGYNFKFDLLVDGLSAASPSHQHVGNDTEPKDGTRRNQLDDNSVFFVTHQRYEITSSEFCVFLSGVILSTGQ